jgi:SAM-dependent methyltransferase
VFVADNERVARDYDRIASSYARGLGGELMGKPLDRALLRYLVEQADGLGPVGDLGCGPGHVTRYLADLGADAVGVDLSPEMIRLASAAHPDPRFVVGDLRCLPLPDASLGAAIAFYSLIHFDGDEDLRVACGEIARVIAPGGTVIVAYHRGNRGSPRRDVGHPGRLAFRFLSDRTVTAALTEAGLDVRARLHREPHPGIEHPTRRTYLLAAVPDR